jgi:hypothetical protein
VADYNTVKQNIDLLRDLTEKKINAVLLRQPTELMHLLQEELDPLRTLNSTMVEIWSFSPAEKDAIAYTCQRWAERAQYLGELLQTQLGYLDFMRTLLGIESTSTINLGL